MLREEREARGISLAEAEEATKIRARYLEALENEAFDVLPGRVYVKGFLRNYARYLGVDGEVLVARYEEQYREPESRPTPPPAALPSERREKRPLAQGLNRRIAAVVLVVALAAGAGWLSGVFGRHHGTAERPAGKPPAAAVGPAPAARTGPAEQAPAATPGAGDNKTQGVNLVLNVVRDSCWMQVVVDGSTQFTGELTANQSRAFQGQKNIWIKLGNAGVVNVQYNGRDMGTLGGPGQVVTRDFPPANQG